ncbi:MAG: C1 family peptidase, partial [Methanobrevibacter sp.]|nr:C1 family peptidase [Methanobrevibacter sp.]
DLRNEFASIIGYSTDASEGVTVNISDEDCPTDSFIFLNYNDFDNHTIAYNSINPRNDLDLRYLNVFFYNLGGNEISIFKVISLMFSIEYLEFESDYNNLYLFDDGEDEGWWTSPIFDDESRVIILDDDNIFAYPFSEEDFSPNEIKGKFNFNFEDRALTSNFGNVYDFKSENSVVPLINSESLISDLPSSYDSRVYGYVTPSDNQGSGGNCWAFAGIATLEACIKKATGATYDFSEDNAKNLMAVSSIYGLNLENNAGGYDTMFMAYLTSWLGPVMDEDDEYNPFSYLSMVLPSLYHIQEISFLPTRQNSEDNDEYKKAIMNNGAVAVMIEWYDSESKSYARHAITLVGWDDDYKGYDFLGNYSRGAWIIKNSWGDDWGDNGCGYLSYQQELSGQVYEYWNAYTFTFPEDSKAYQDIYQYDFAGLSDYMVFDEDVVYYKNKFIAKDDEFLSAFSTYFERETEFTFSVRINGKDITTTDDDEPIISSIHTSSAGYHTIPLGYDLELEKGDEFEIIIKLINSNKNYVPVCQAEEL